MQLITHEEQMADGIDCYLDAHFYTYLASSEDVQRNDRGDYRPSRDTVQFLHRQHSCLAGIWVHPQTDGSFHIKAMEA